MIHIAALIMLGAGLMVWHLKSRQSPMNPYLTPECVARIRALEYRDGPRLRAYDPN